MTWQLGLRPATFAGVGFYVKMQKAKGGQRLVMQELPFANVWLENQGKLPKQFTVTAYFLGDGWLAQREQLLAVLDASTTAQTLVLPTKGPLNVWVGNYSYQDDEQIGAYGAIDIEFTVDTGAANAPFANADTASALLANINAMATQIQTAFASVMGPIAQEAAIANYQANLLASAAASVLELPAALLSGVTAIFTATPTNPVNTAAVVTTALLAAGDNAAALNNPTTATTTAVSGVVPISPLPPDASLGLAALANWGAGYTAPLYPATLSTALGAVMRLVQQSAALAVVSLYAQTSFATAQAASAARTQLAGLLDAVGENIVNAGQVDLYRAWLALSTLSIQDMLARAQNLPSTAAYKTPFSLPDVVLAQQLLADGSQGDALFALNQAVHPLFMPLTGVWVQAA